MRAKLTKIDSIPFIIIIISIMLIILNMKMVRCFSNTCGKVGGHGEGGRRMRKHVV